MKRVGKYLGITFAISWGLMGIMLLANQYHMLEYSSIGGTLVVAVIAFSPALASYAVFEAPDGICKKKAFTLYIFRNILCVKTWLVLAVCFLVHMAVGIFCGRSTGIPVYMCIPYLPMMILGGGLEEIGWRGYLQPAMEAKFSPVPATILIGIIWAFWHTPMWFIKGSGQAALNYGLFFLFCIWLSFMLNFILRTTKSVFACILFHAWSNVVANLFSGMVLENWKLAIIYLVEIIICVFIGKTSKIHSADGSK